MLEIFQVEPPKRERITNLSQPLLLELLDGHPLNGQQKLALLRLMKEENRVYGVYQREDLLRDLNNLIPGKLRSAQLELGEDEDTDSRGNNRNFVVRETELATSPFFNENYALNELNKLKRKAIREKVLELKFNDIELTLHDVPKNQQHRVMNVREFIGTELYPRLAKRHGKLDRLIARVWTRTTETQKAYLKFRERFPEPTNPKPGDPLHRGRKDAPSSSSDEAPQHLEPGLMTPRTARASGMNSLSIPKPFERKTPGKELFIPPLENEEDLLNEAENMRRTGEFPFGAGPSGSMAYDLAVYAHYLVEWKKLELDSKPFREKMILFGVSRAVGYVKYGHHSFHETLITLYDYVDDKKIFSDPNALYEFLTPYMEMGLRDEKSVREGEKFHTKKNHPATHFTGFKVHWDSYAADWMDWRSYKPENYAQWTIKLVGNKPVGLDGEAIPPGKYIYVVLAKDKSFRYLPTEPNTGEQYRSHSQLAGGLSVFAAGYFQLGDDYRVEVIDNSSGHYKPGPESVQYAKQRLTKLGFDTSTTVIKAHNPTVADTQWIPWFMQQAMTHARIMKGRVWANQDRYKSFPKPPPDLAKHMPY